MTFIDALKTVRIVIHDQLIGGYLLLDGKIYHRDNVLDFNHPDWIKKNCNSIYDENRFLFNTGCPLLIFLSDDWQVI